MSADEHAHAPADGAGAPQGEVIDVDRLMEDIRARAAAKRAPGDAGAVPPAAAPADGDLGALRRLAALRYDVGVGPSSAPLVGPLVTQAKRHLARGVSQPGYDLTAQLNAFNAALIDHVDRLTADLADARERIARLEADHDD
ncbi:MAG: hypothetical protein AB7V42_13335 [Thermoleophilia bacterium]